MEEGHSAEVTAYYPGHVRESCKSRLESQKPEKKARGEGRGGIFSTEISWIGRHKILY